MSRMPAYLINLDGSTDRLRSATEQLNAFGITFQRVPAFDGRNLTINEFPDYDHPAAIAYMGRPMRGGEVGCYLSHLDTARRFLASNEPIGLVLEDDLQLAPSFAEGLPLILDWLQKPNLDWDIFHLAANRRKIFTPVHQFTVAGLEHRIELAHYFPMTTTALLWSHQGAQAFVDAHRSISMPVDNYLRHWETRRGRGLSVWPALVTTTGAASEIDGNLTRREKSDRHPLYSLRKQRRLLTDKAHALRHKLAARHRLP